MGASIEGITLIQVNKGGKKSWFTWWRRWGSHQVVHRGGGNAGGFADKSLLEGGAGTGLNLSNGAAY